MRSIHSYFVTVDPAEANGMLEEMRERDASLSDDRAVFAAASKNEDFWSDAADAAHDYRQFIRSGRTRLPIYVQNFFMLRTGLASR